MPKRRIQYEGWVGGDAGVRFDREDEAILFVRQGLGRRETWTRGGVTRVIILADGIEVHIRRGSYAVEEDGFVRRQK